MCRVRLALVAVTLSTVGGCIYDGAYLIKGTVSAEGAGSRTPLPGATVVTKNGSEGTRQAPITTAADGTYEVKYVHGGMGFLFIVPGDGDPYAEFAAPGYRTRTVRLRGKGAADGAAPAACGPAAAVRCFELDAVLTPEASSISRSPGPD